MAGGVMYETSTHPSLHHPQEVMSDWGGIPRREKENLLNDRPVPSPTYSHLSVADSNAVSSPYNLTQTVQLPTSSAYQYGYPTLTGSHLAPIPLQSSRYQHPHSGGYYAQPEHDLYSTPQAASSRSKLSPSTYDQQSLEVHQSQLDSGSAPLLTTSSLSRTYNSTIPQYYPITSDGSRWAIQTPDKPEGSTRKRRVPRDTPPSAGKALKTPKRAKSHDAAASGRPSKRVKLETDRPASAQPPYQNQLPTPPSTGKDVSHLSLPHHIRVQAPDEDMFVLVGNSPEGPMRRSGVVVTQHQDEGRKLGLVGVGSGEAEFLSDEARLTPRLTSIPALTTDSTGMAFFATEEVLESEVAWLQNGGRAHSPPSSPDVMQLRTPTTSVDNVVVDENESPGIKADKVSKRLELFGESDRAEEPMVSTRIDMFGRVAVRKNTALKFLGLDGTANIIEETRADDDDSWTERPIASSSRTRSKPSWPDHEAPWALAGGSRKEKKQKEESQKAATLRRYLETASDESSDDESVITITYGKGKGKNVQRLIRSSASETSDTDIRRWDHVNTDARIALANAVRHRALPTLPMGKMACACGSSAPVGMGPMIECCGCRTWHHLQCNGIDDDTVIGPQWWCPQCQVHAMAMSTPAHSTPRVYTQSDERSSAFKGEMANIALAPSPMFVTGSFTQTATAARTPLNRVMASPTSRQHRSRILSYGTDMWAYTEDGAPSSAAPSTPGPSRPDRYSTPRIDDIPFDVTSTPSRHLDFNFGQPSLFSLTPLGGRGRVTSGQGMMIGETPLRARQMSMNQPLSEIIPSRHEFFREMNKGSQTELPASPQTRWPHALLGAHNLSPSPFGHRRSLSGNKMSSMRSSSRSGLAGLGMSMTEEKDEE